MIFKLEHYSEILTDIIDIVPEFMAEVDIYPESPKPNLDHDQFLAMDERSQLQTIVAWGKDGLEGIHVAAVLPDIFYKHILTAYVLWYYLKPKSRGTGHGLTMFSFADKHFKKRGVERIFMSRKIYMPNENLFKRLEYTHIESGYTKYIGEG